MGLHYLVEAAGLQDQMVLVVEMVFHEVEVVAVTLHG